MRHVLVSSIALLALVAAVPVVAGDTCLPLCEVRTVDAAEARYAYVPAVTFLSSGSSVAWSALDTAPHTASDLDSFCFHVSFIGPAIRSVQFFVADGALFADVPHKDPEACAAALPLPDGTFALAYGCAVHPGAMEGRIVVK